MSREFIPHTISLSVNSDDESYVLYHALRSYASSHFLLSEDPQEPQGNGDRWNLEAAAARLASAVHDAWLDSPNGPTVVPVTAAPAGNANNASGAV